MTTIDMTGASDAEFEARNAPFEADERVETVARAIYAAAHRDCPFPGCTFDASDPDEYRTLAAAAIAALPPSPAEEAIKRVEALAERFNDPVRNGSFPGQTALFGGGDVCWRIRAALASPAPAPEPSGACDCPACHDDEDD